MLYGEVIEQTGLTFPSILPTDSVETQALLKYQLRAVTYAMDVMDVMDTMGTWIQAINSSSSDPMDTSTLSVHAVQRYG